MGWDGLRAHKMRSALTALGIVFGVAAVIAMLAIGEGAKRKALAKYASLGTDTVIVRAIPRSLERLDQDRADFSPGLSLEDAHHLSRLLSAQSPPSLQSARSERSSNMRRGDRSLTAPLVGVDANYRQIQRLHVTSGRWLHPMDIQSEARVCVLGREIKRHLFDFERAEGSRIKIGSQWFTVIGVLADRPEGGHLGGDTPNLEVLAPISTVLQRFPRAFPHPQLDQITLSTSGEVSTVALITARSLRRRHRGVEDFAIVVPEQLLAEEARDQRLFNTLLAAIAGISLLVGGIGIMNIMLATVQERVKEIGIRRAVGATSTDVVLQFLLEAALLSVAGALAGVVLGIGMAHSIDLFADFSAEISPLPIVLAFGVALSVGLTFGIYPARRAAALDPIEALHHE